MKTLITNISRIFPKLLFVAVLLSGSKYLNAQDDTKKAAGDLLWSDEFDGTGIPNPAKWDRPEYNRRNNVAGPDGWWSKEDSYLDGQGNLVIRVRKIADKNADGDSCDYSVGAVRTLGKYMKLYGKFEIRCKLPTQPGWWVAFWMMQGNVGSVGNGGVDGSEVDIMEGFGWTNLINNAFHWDGYGADHKSVGKQFRPAGIRDGFHTYAMEWYPEMYVFFIDGKETWRSTGGGVCNQPGYIKVTGEISTEDWAMTTYWSNKQPANAYPDSFIVDYVRVYELGDYKFPTGIGSVSSSKSISLFPNPAAEQVTVQWDETSYPGNPDICILNALGQEVMSFEQVKNNSALNISGLKKGLYMVRFRLGNSMGSLRFIKS